MSDEAAFLSALHDEPGELAHWLVLADWLDDAGRAEQAELLRLRVALMGASSTPERARGQAQLQTRVQRLLAGKPGSQPRPFVPTRTVAGLVFALIPAGAFTMGSPESESGRWADEGPQRRVELTRPFYLGVYPVTQAQWQRVMGPCPSRFSGETRPAANVSWNQCVEYCRLQSAATGLTFRLPTEAEWEYACRAGTTTPFHTGRGPKAMDRAGWVACGETKPVGDKEPNVWGLYDMHGNVLEWCSDWFDPRYYATGETVDPTGPPSGTGRVERGGCYGHQLRHCRSAFRRGSHSTYEHEGTGFRVVLEWTPPPS